MRQRHVTIRRQHRHLAASSQGKDLSGTLQGAGGVGGRLYLTVSTSNIEHQTSNQHLYILCCDNNGNVTRYSLLPIRCMVPRATFRRSRGIDGDFGAMRSSRPTVRARGLTVPNSRFPSSNSIRQSANQTIRNSRFPRAHLRISPHYSPCRL